MNITKKRKKYIIILSIIAAIILIITALIIHINIHAFDEGKAVAVEYVSKKYGDHYEVVSVDPYRVSPMPFANHVYWVTVEFADKEGKESNFRIKL